MLALAFGGDYGVNSDGQRALELDIGLVTIWCLAYFALWPVEVLQQKKKKSYGPKKSCIVVLMSEIHETSCRLQLENESQSR